MASATTSSHVPSSRRSRGAWSPTARRRRTPARRSVPEQRSIPLQCPFLPHVDEPDQQNRDEYDHLDQPEERHLPAGTHAVDERPRTRELTEVRPPRDHEDGLDVED